ncbi:MAG: ATP-binding protein [Gammaproteobacteria bacterium]|jgi:predicted AAA+ superfamily ATPase|nr:ATP-binding protein [Gammaproteobacteria bacterium]
MPSVKRLLRRLDRLIDRLEPLLPPPPAAPDFSALAHRWRRTDRGGTLRPVAHPHAVALDDLLCMERQKAEVVRNTRQFVAGRPANNVLLWGSRGTGKSTLVKAVFNAYAAGGLRLVEVDKQDLVDLPDIVDLLYDRPERYLVFCDDLSFEADDPSYKALKAVLEGSIVAPPGNVLVYATSNRRHLMPEYHAENLETRLVEGEIHHGEAVEEKISLSERFGLWLSFYPFSQDDYLAICDHWLRQLGGRGVGDEPVRRAALQWALARGSRSGRVARQFALDWAGRGLDCFGSASQ